jgi:hypothetical protein
MGEHKGTVQGLHRGHGGVQSSQELFHRQQVPLVPEAQGLGDSFLGPEGEPVGPPAGPQVGVVARWGGPSARAALIPEVAMKPLRLIPDNTKLPFMKWARVRTPISLVLMALSLVLFFTVGVN